MIWFTTVIFLCLSAVLSWHYATCQSNGLLSSSSYRSYTENDITETDTMAENGTGQMDVFRLPGDVFPESYTLKVATDFANLAFSGHVEILIKTVKSTCRLTLNAKDVNVTRVAVVDHKSNAPLDVVDYYLVDRNEQLIIDLNDTKICVIASRLYIIRIEYNASLRDDMSGYYKSSYKENNEIKYELNDLTLYYEYFNK